MELAALGQTFSHTRGRVRHHAPPLTGVVDNDIDDAHDTPGGGNANRQERGFLRVAARNSGGPKDDPDHQQIEEQADKRDNSVQKEVVFAARKGDHRPDANQGVENERSEVGSVGNARQTDGRALATDAPDDDGNGGQGPCRGGGRRPFAA